MQHTLVQSSMVKSFGYDPKTSTLELAFHDGSVYAYEGVPPSIPQIIPKTRSVGSFLRQRVTSRYHARKLDQEQLPQS